MNFIINCKVFPFDVMFSVKESEQDLRAKLKSYGQSVDDIFTKSEAHTLRLEGGQIIVRFNNLTHGLVAHEIYHAAYLMLEHMGVKPCNKSDEVYAYLIGYLTDEFYKKVKIK